MARSDHIHTILLSRYPPAKFCSECGNLLALQTTLNQSNNDDSLLSTDGSEWHQLDRMKHQTEASIASRPKKSGAVVIKEEDDLQYRSPALLQPSLTTRDPQRLSLLGAIGETTRARAISAQETRTRPTSRLLQLTIFFWRGTFSWTTTLGDSKRKEWCKGSPW